MKGVRHLPTLRKKDSKDLSYPAAAAPLLRGMLVSILARCNVQLDPTRQMLAKPSCINKGSVTIKFLAWMELALPDQKQDVCQIKLGDATFWGIDSMHNIRHAVYTSVLHAYWRPDEADLSQHASRQLARLCMSNVFDMRALDDQDKAGQHNTLACDLVWHPSSTQIKLGHAVIRTAARSADAAGSHAC